VRDIIYIGPERMIISLVTIRIKMKWSLLIINSRTPVAVLLSNLYGQCWADCVHILVKRRSIEHKYKSIFLEMDVDLMFLMHS